MVKEKLKKALEDAVGYYNGGLSANDAVVKSASDHDLTVDQTDRIVESFNTAKTINFFDKNASDRTGKFDLADKKSVTLSLFGKEGSEKKASAVVPSNPENVISNFYFTPPDSSKNRKNVFAEKRAEFLDMCAKAAEEKWAHGYSDNTLHDMVGDTYSILKSAEADAEEAVRTINSYLVTATMKIAENLSGGGYDTPEDRADLFKTACPHKIVVDEVSKVSPLLKKATGGKYSRLNVVDTSSIDDILKEAEDIVEAVEQRKVYRQKQAEFHKKAEEFRSSVLKDPSVSEIVRSNSTAESYIHRPMRKSAGSDIIPTSDVKRITDILTPSKSRKKDNEAIRDEARGAILADLMSSDPILQDADPRQIASIYKSIIQSSPRVSLNKEIIRSVLRGAVNSIALSPNDTKVLTDVDLGINKAFNLSNLDSSIKDSAS